jgi:predicted HTH transcriptional regulator
MDFPFTTEVDAWTWDTVTSLSGHDENQHLEYKTTINPPDDSDSGETEWNRKLEREITAFANATGGIIIFGVDDDGNPSPFEPPSHEVKQSVIRFIQNTRPLVDADIPAQIEVPSDDTDRIILPVRIYEADRKPVLTGDAAVYRRINDRKEPMSREQMESLFVEHDRRQQAIRQLEMEINRFEDIYNGEENRFSMHGESPPNYHLLNIESLKQVFRENTHLVVG